jgi:hypothetical protein
VAIDRTAIATLTAPAGVDGRGEVAVLNNPADATNFVGYVVGDSGFDGAPMRTSVDEITEGHGAVFGNFYDGPRSFTLDIQLALAATSALSFARRDKLYRAFNAKAADGTFVYTETGGAARLLSFRREQPPRGPDDDRIVTLAGICEDPRIFANAISTAGPGTFTVAGTVDTDPTLTLTSPTNTITISRTSPSPTETLTLTGLSGAGTVTVNFLTQTITTTSGASPRPSAEAFPSSVWWVLAPGSNTVSVSGATCSASGIAYRAAW